MHPLFFSPDYGPVEMVEGIPAGLSRHLLPGAKAYYAAGRYGIFCVQIIPTQKQLLSYFLFTLSQRFSFSFLNPTQGLFTLFNVNGRFIHRVDGSEDVLIYQREYLLYSACQEVLHTTVEAGPLSALLQIYHSEDSYGPLLPLFPKFASRFTEQQGKPFHFFQAPTYAPFPVHAAIRSILQDRYSDQLQQKHIELHLERTLFEQLHHCQTQRPVSGASSLEKEKAVAAYHLLLHNIKRPWTVGDIALELHCTPSWLKKAFSKVYGVGLYHFLRRARMEKAQELFRQGESLKAVAIEVGMKPHNFPKEFKSYFGFTVTQFKKSLSA